MVMAERWLSSYSVMSRLMPLLYSPIGRSWSPAYLWKDSQSFDAKGSGIREDCSE